MSDLTADQAEKLDALARRIGVVRQEMAAQPSAARQSRIAREVSETVGAFPPEAQFVAFAALAAKLTDAAPHGVASSSGSPSGVAVPEAVVRDLKSRLQLSDAETPDPQRTQELASMLCEFVLGVDRVVWGMWSKKLAPQSTLRSSGPMLRFMKEQVLGAASQGGPTTATEVRRLLEMTVALVSAIGQAGSAFGDKFVSQYSPASVEDAAGEGTFRNKDAECWKMYKARASALDRASIDAEVTQAVAKFVEEWMKRSVRS